MSSNQALMAPNLLNKLALALIDPEFNEINGWVKKAKTKFFNSEKEWDKQEISRELGGILGNDLGQMRLGWQFDMKSYIVDPPYRDDNWGLWDFGEEEKPTDILEDEQMFDSIRIEQQLDDNSDQPDQERKENDQNEELSEKPVQLEIQKSEGIPVARYPEYDYLTGRERPDWTTIIDYRPPIGSIKNVERAIEQYAEVLKRITSLIRAARVSRPNRSNRLQEGEYLDIDACIDAKINQRMNLTPDPRVYGKWIRKDRDLSVLVLLDISESTRDKVFNSKESVLDLEVHATALLAQAMSKLGDPFAIAAFCSNKRDDVRYFRIKDFNEPFDQKTFSYLGGLEGGFSTRIGAAIRHAGSQLKEQQTYRKLLLVVTDGEPSDIDATDPRYLLEDARRSVKSLSHEGINVFCVGLETKGSSYLEKIFERRNSIVIDRIELLPQKLPLLYLRMTA
jgi:nitric oxide reductase activation protein